MGQRRFIIVSTSINPRSEQILEGTIGHQQLIIRLVSSRYKIFLPNWRFEHCSQRLQKEKGKRNGRKETALLSARRVWVSPGGTTLGSFSADVIDCSGGAGAIVCGAGKKREKAEKASTHASRGTFTGRDNCGKLREIGNNVVPREKPCRFFLRRYPRFFLVVWGHWTMNEWGTGTTMGDSGGQNIRLGY